MTSSYPLQWPEGWQRTPNHARKNSSPFQTTFDRARRHLLDQLRMLGARNVVISSWLPLRNDGQPRADAARRRIDDPGVAVYFTHRKKQMVMARDAYWTVHDNLRSIGLAIEHLRGLERHGGGTMMDRAFEGFSALPAPKSWREILNNPATLADAEAFYRRRIRDVHPDTENGSHAAAAELNAAMDQARKELR